MQFRVAEPIRLIALLALSLSAIQPTDAETKSKSVEQLQKETSAYFDPTQWNDSHKFHLGGGSRESECSKLLKQYDLIGMSRAEIHLLLGDKSPQ